MLSKKEQSNLQKYSQKNSDLLLHVAETVNGDFCIRPIRWSASYSGGKLKDGKYLAKFQTKEEAVDALVTYCGYTRNFAVSLSR